MDQIPIISPLLDHCPATLPARWYRDAAHHAAEMRAIFARHWIYAGRAADQRPMTVRRLAVADHGVILVKDQAGAFTAFHNTCRHRGAELCREDETQLAKKLITCPYHAWGYDLQGRLQRVSFATPTPDFRKEEHGLFPVHVKEWNGFVFVCLADDPPDFDQAPDLGPTALDNWPMRDLVTGHRVRTEIACNWKVFWENYNECLHCPGIHPELCDLVPVYGKGHMAASEMPDWRGADEPALRPGARSWTVSGGPCGPEFAHLTAAQRQAGHLFVTLLPTMYIVAHVDYVRTVSLRPLGPERTELTAEWLFPAETLAQPGFDLAAVTGFAATVMRQDGEACEINQRGLKSPKYGHGTLMPQEFDVHRFQNWVRAQLGTASQQTGGSPCDA